VTGWRVAGTAVRPTVSDDVIMVQLTLVRDESEPTVTGPTVGDLLESYHGQLPEPGRHAE